MQTPSVGLGVLALAATLGCARSTIPGDGNSSAVDVPSEIDSSDIAVDSIVELGVDSARPDISPDVYDCGSDSSACPNGDGGVVCVDLRRLVGSQRNCGACGRTCNAPCYSGQCESCSRAGTQRTCCPVNLDESCWCAGPGQFDHCTLCAPDCPDGFECNLVTDTCEPTVVPDR